jgi:hypothetical protein
MRPRLLPAACVLLVAACGSGATSGAPGGPTAPVPAATAARTPGASVATDAAPAVGTPGGAPVAGQAVQACDLLTDADIEQVTGYGVLTREPGHVMGIFPNGCLWELGSESETTLWTIDVGVISPGGRHYFDTYLSFPDMTDPVPGLGDAAVTDDGGSITAVKGDSLVSVFLILFGDTEDEMVRELTEIALSRVP